jgi:hypothetical protein
MPSPLNAYDDTKFLCFLFRIELTATKCMTITTAGFRYRAQRRFGIRHSGVSAFGLGLIMHIPSLALATLLFAGTASAASATTYTLTFSGPDFTTSVNGDPGDQTIILSTPIAPGHTGFAGGPDQLWGEMAQGPQVGGWLDFFKSGTAIRFEGATTDSSLDQMGGLYLVAASPFYSIGAASPPFNLTFPGFPHNAGTEVVSMENEGFYGGSPADGSGNVDSLTIAAAPEVSTWVMMFMGFAGLGSVGYGANRKRAVIA